MKQPFDNVTLEQLRVFVAVADAGSFSAAARAIGRVQSAVSQAMAAFETGIGFKVWDRTERAVALTERGRRLLVDARRVLGEVDRMRDAAKAMQSGRTERLAICVDALFPPRALVSLAHAMKDAFPGIELRVETDTLAAVGTRVASRACDVGIAGPLVVSDKLDRVAVGSVLLVPAAARTHRLATLRGPLSLGEIRGETQIVLSERDEARATPDQGVLSEQTWRVVDLGTKRELIRGGLGWGNLPAPLDGDELVRLAVEAWSEEEHRLPLHLVFPPGLRRRPLVRWLLENLPALCTSYGVGLPSV